MAEEYPVEQWVDDYRACRDKYVKFTDRLAELLRLLVGDEVDAEVTSRTKEVGSFKAKLERKGELYSDPLVDMPDLVGLRVTTYYVDDLERVESVLADNFAIDRERSYVASYDDPGRFGYQSTHFVLTLSPARAELPEWKPFGAMCAEVQVRTVLQHAWAAISHRVEYKEEGEVPRHLQRKLFRLSALLEAADEDFAELQKGIAAAREDSREKVSAGDLEIALDLESLRAFLDVTNRHEDYNDCARLLGFHGAQLEDGLDEDEIRDLLNAFNYAELRTIDAVDAAFPTDTTWAKPHLIQLKTISGEDAVDFPAWTSNTQEILVISLNRSRDDVDEFIDGTRWGEAHKNVLHRFVAEPAP